MIERDYIMRILQDFFNAIAKLMRLNLDDPDTSHVQERFNEMYRQFFRSSAEHFYETEKEMILDSLEQEGRSEQDTHARVRMLSELLYQDGLVKKSIPEKCIVLEKALYLLEYLDRNSRTFSWERNQKINDIKKILTEFEY
ncbi:MAG: hypothetical protein LBS79_02455 [Tannerella sp.]|jgi:hypothetical protein|nr:hypothetical protein [Tannerella sp.]